MNSLRERLVPFARLAFIVWFTCIAVSIVIQNHTAFLPFGVFNTRTHQIDRLADAILLVVVAALVVLILEFSMRRSWVLARAIRWSAVLVLFLEVGLHTTDRLIMAGKATRARGPHYEERLADGTPVIMRHSRGGIPVDFCDAPGDSFRVLFLGDSYTEGSGRAPQCNYPDVVEEALRRHWRDDARVINAGVNAHGPVESLHLLQWYRERGCRFDAVVFHIFLENDLTDNLPGTRRRVVAGLAFRFPESSFLRAFHPLNTWLFRWSMFAAHVVRQPKGAEEAARIEPGQCDPGEETLGELTPFLRALIENRLSGSERIASADLAHWPALEAVEEMNETTRDLGVPLVLVIFPDRVLVDPELQEQMNIVPGDLDAPQAIRAMVRERFRDVPTVDTSEVLAGRKGMHRVSDTHLSDVGNQIVGRYVAAELTGYLARAGERDTGP